MGIFTMVQSLHYCVNHSVWAEPQHDGSTTA